jgi:site-specific DNA recombinase
MGFSGELLERQLRAAIYARQSSDRSGEGLGVSRQFEDGERLVALRGAGVAERLCDNDLSASGRKRRPDFEKLLKLIDIVVAWDMTRLTRNARDRLRLIEACQKSGVVLWLVRGSDIDLTTPAGRLVAGILAEVAQHEIDQKADRQRRAGLQAALAGKPPARRRAFGFEPDGVTVRKSEAAAIRKGYRDVLAGVPIGRVARDWNVRGFRAMGGREWAVDNVRYVLLSPRYAGLRSYRGQVVAKATWPAIVREETWRAVVTMLTDPARAVGPRGSEHLLSKLARCGSEGCTSHVHSGGRMKGHRVYRCAQRNGHVSRKAEPVEAYIVQVVVERLSRPDASSLLLTDSQRPDVEHLQTERLAAQLRLDQVAKEFAEGELTASQLRTINETLTAKIDDLNAQLADAGRVDVLGPLVAAADVRAAWNRLDRQRQRAVIALLMDITLLPPGRGTQIFRPGSVVIKWKGDAKAGSGGATSRVVRSAPQKAARS